MSGNVLGQLFCLLCCLFEVGGDYRIQLGSSSAAVVNPVVIVLLFHCFIAAVFRCRRGLVVGLFSKSGAKVIQFFDICKFFRIFFAFFLHFYCFSHILALFHAKNHTKTAYLLRQTVPQITLNLIP